MSVSQKEVNALIAVINKNIKKQGMSFVITGHFSLDRLNDVRNNPPITILELESILTRLIDQYIFAIAKLPHNSTFNIRCSSSHINMPCGVSKTLHSGKSLHKNTIITIMRKETFKSKDPTEFLV